MASIPLGPPYSEVAYIVVGVHDHALMDWGEQSNEGAKREEDVDDLFEEGIAWDYAEVSNLEEDRVFLSRSRLRHALQFPHRDDP